MLQRVKSLAEFGQVEATRRLLMSINRLLSEVGPKIELDKTTYREVFDIQKKVLCGSPIDTYEIGLWGIVWQQLYNCRIEREKGRRLIAAGIVEFACYIADAASREETPIKIPQGVAVLILGDIYHHLHNRTLFDIIETTSVIEEKPIALLKLTKHGQKGLGLSGQVELPFPVFEFWTPQKLLGNTWDGTSYLILCRDDGDVQMHRDMIDDPPQKKLAARRKR